MHGGYCMNGNFYRNSTIRSFFHDRKSKFRSKNISKYLHPRPANFSNHCHFTEKVISHRQMNWFLALSRKNDFLYLSRYLKSWNLTDTFSYFSFEFLFAFFHQQVSHIQLILTSSTKFKIKQSRTLFTPDANVRFSFAFLVREKRRR